MKGIVNMDLNERQLSPSVNAPISGYYKKGDVVSIEDMVPGDEYDGDDLWYKLSNGAYVWNGGVDVEADCTSLTDNDKEHFLLCYREVLPDGRPDMASKKAPVNLSFAPIRLPVASESIRVNTLLPGPFAQGVIQSVKKLNNPVRNQVLIYIHGYQLLSSLKLDLLSQFVQNYLTLPQNKIAKVLFLTWPGQGGPSRKTVDDRSIRAGQQFTTNGLLDVLKTLSDELATEGIDLNLMVHSFGHQLLNGMLNPDQAKALPRNIFKNIFLMAPDVTHLAVQQGGAFLRNYFQDKDGTDYHYEYTRLKDLAHGQVHIFHDKYDYLLYSSTKKFVGRGNRDAIKLYRGLGNYGKCEILPPALPIDFEYHDVQELVLHGVAGRLKNYPFRNIIGTSPGRRVDNVWNNGDYSGINAGRIIFNAKRFPNHHRYLITCKQVVDKVLELL